MKTQEAHDIVNKEINVILKGCGYIWFNSLSEKEQSIVDEDICMKNQYCPSCKTKLKVIISQEATEIERWNIRINSRLKEGLVDYNAQQIVKALKISILDLQEKIK